MGKDPAHLTGDGYPKLASGVLRMAEGPDVVFSGAKRAHDGEKDRPAPTISGRKAWIYSSSSGHGRGGGRGGSRGGATGRGGPAYRSNGGGGTGYQLAGGQISGYQSGGYNNKGGKNILLVTNQCKSKYLALSRFGNVKYTGLLLAVQLWKLISMNLC